MADHLAEYLQALDEDEARAGAILATFDNEERAELDAYLAVAGRLSRAGREMAAVTARPSEDAFLAHLYAMDSATRVRHMWRLPRLQGMHLASRSLFAGGLVFLGLAVGAASAFSGDPLGLSRALPLLNIESASDDGPRGIEQTPPLLNPLQSDGQSQGVDVVAPGGDGTPPGQGGENPGQGVGPDGDPPGQGDENPGQGVGPDGDPPGQGGENPGNGGGNGNRNNP